MEEDLWVVRKTKVPYRTREKEGEFLGLLKIGPVERTLIRTEIQGPRRSQRASEEPR